MPARALLYAKIIINRKKREWATEEDSPDGLIDLMEKLREVKEQENG